MGPTDWTLDPMYDSEWTTKYGFLDAKPDWQALSETQGFIKFRIEIGYNIYYRQQHIKLLQLSSFSSLFSKVKQSLYGCVD